MNLDQLEAVQTVIDKGSFRAAAEYLHRSQPALSASIKNLEEEFGIQIFDRSDYRPKLTEVGAVFINSAKKTLEASYHTMKIARELGQHQAETKIRVSVDPLVPVEAIELIAQECARPVIPVVLILDKTILQRSHNLILEGKIDLALAPCPPNETSIDKIVIESVTLVAAVSRKLLQEKRKADDNFLKKHAQILVHDGDFDNPPDGLMPNPIYIGVGPKIYVPDHFTKLQLIKSGVGWGRLSLTEFESDTELVMIDKKICEHIKLELCLMKAKYKPIGPIARAIWNVFEMKAALDKRIN